MKKNNIAKIIPLTRLKRDLHFFDYIIPDQLLNIAKKGQLVEVNFRNKKIQGVIHSISSEHDVPISKIKKITNIIDPTPFLSSWQLKLADFMASYYFTSTAAVVKMMVAEPPVREKQSQSHYIPYTSFKPFKVQTIPRIPTSDKPIVLKYISQDKKITAYIQLIEKAIKSKSQIAIIVPLISDINSLYQYLQKYKEKTSIFLNNLPKNRYFAEWEKIKKQHVNIIIGTRSALFAPFNNLQSIIIDQEDNENHKQEEPNPRYHVKTVALKICELTKARPYLASQTPSLETLYAVHQKHYDYLELDTLEQTPEITIIDRNQEFKKDNYSIFSEELFKRIEQHVYSQKKVFLFLNRKGSSSVVTCSDCGKISMCPTCNLPLTLHQSQKLKCHHCGFEQDMILFCPTCKSPHIKLTGAGTEKVEHELATRLRTANILKIDIDTPLPDNAYEAAIQKADIIIGTSYAFQYIDWDKIHLTGILAADQLFHLPDFRSAEKTFNLLYYLLINTVGERKYIFLQTLSPDNYIIKAVQNLSIKEYYAKEIVHREMLQYPPFSTLVKLILQHDNFNQGEQISQKQFEVLKQQLHKIPEIMIFPPAPAHVQQVRGKFRWHIILKIPKNTKLDFLYSLPENWIIDKDPESLL